MPSIFTLEGPSLAAIPNGKSRGYQTSDFDQVQLAIGMRVEMEHTTDPAIAQQIAMDHLVEDSAYYQKLAKVHLDGNGLFGIAWWKLLLIGAGVAGSILGLRELRQRHEDKQQRKPLRGPSMLKTIAAEAKSPVEYARRIEAWNAAEAKPLPVTKLAKAYRKGKSAEIARLIREAHEERIEKREGLWTKMSRGLRGAPSLRVGQHFDHFGHTYRITKITRGKKPVVYIARPSRDSFGKEVLIDARSFQAQDFDRQHLRPLDGLRGFRAA